MPIRYANQIDTQHTMFKPLLLCSDMELQHQLHLMLHMHQYFQQTICQDPSASKQLHEHQDFIPEAITDCIASIRSTTPDQQDNDSDSYEHCASDTDSYEDIPNQGMP